MKVRLAVTIAVMLLLTMVISIDDGSDADVPVADETVYLFSYDLTFFYDLGGNPESVEWDAIGLEKDGGSEFSLTILGDPSSENSWRMYLDREQVSLCSDIYVTQTVHGSSTVSEKTSRCIILGDSSEQDPFAITFYDGYSGEVVHTDLFYPTTIVYFGEAFAEVPNALQRDQYDFIGWFYGPDLSQRFDPYAPVTGDVDVYAKWVYTGTSSGDVGSILIGNHLVTFECSAGLTYTIEDRGSNHVSFSVSAAPGFDVDESTITAHANGTQIHPVDGIHTISGISSDVHVVIAGDLISSENGSADGGIPFWVWIVLIIVIVVAVAVVYWMYIRNQRQ